VIDGLGFELGENCVAAVAWGRLDASPSGRTLATWSAGSQWRRSAPRFGGALGGSRLNSRSRFLQTLPRANLEHPLKL
jgi:hypothetical protein